VALRLMHQAAAYLSPPPHPLVLNVWRGSRRCVPDQADGTTRFGALATGLGGVSEEYRFECPPYIVLLCRTFLTLEGIATVRRSRPDVGPPLALGNGD
jgi:hypothetical protein